MLRNSRKNAKKLTRRNTTNNNKKRTCLCARFSVDPLWEVLQSSPGLRVSRPTVLTVRLRFLRVRVAPHALFVSRSRFSFCFCCGFRNADGPFLCGFRNADGPAFLSSALQMALFCLASAMQIFFGGGTRNMKQKRCCVAAAATPRRLRLRRRHAAATAPAAAPAAAAAAAP